MYKISTLPNKILHSELLLFDFTDSIYPAFIELVRGIYIIFSNSLGVNLSFVSVILTKLFTHVVRCKISIYFVNGPNRFNRLKNAIS